MLANDGILCYLFLRCSWFQAMHSSNFPLFLGAACVVSGKLGPRILQIEENTCLPVCIVSQHDTALWTTPSFKMTNFASRLVPKFEPQTCDTSFNKCISLGKLVESQIRIDKIQLLRVIRFKFFRSVAPHPLLFPLLWPPRGPNDVLRKHFRVTNADGTRILDEFRQRCLEAPHGGRNLVVRVAEVTSCGGLRDPAPWLKSLR